VRRERDAFRRSAGTTREAFRRFAQENLRLRIGVAFGPEAGSAAGEERRRQREARVVRREIAADDDEVATALRALREEGIEG
jgi:hypothetical protein